MAASNGTITLPNPHHELVPSTQTYATVGSLAVLLWDIFLHLPKDYKLATKFRVNFFFVIYWISRLASLVYVLGVVIISTATVENCDFFRLVAILYPFANPLSILPFVVRVFALYKYNKCVIAFFSIAWLSVLCSCVLMPIGVRSMKIDTDGTRKYCLQNQVVSTVAIRFCLFIHDTFIFMATSWALMRNYSYSDANLGVKKGIRVMVLGRDLFPFSKSILREGQAYYLIVLIFKLIYLVLPYTVHTVRTQCTIAVVLISNMSSYVYRNMRLGVFQDYTTSSSAINKALEGPSKSVRRHPELVFQKPTLSMKCSEDGGDLEAGDIRKADEVEEFEVTGSRNSKGDQTEKM